MSLRYGRDAMGHEGQVCVHVSMCRYGVCVCPHGPDPPRARPSPNARWTVLEAYEEGTPPPPSDLPWREMDDFKSWGGYPLDPPFT